MRFVGSLVAVALAPMLYAQAVPPAPPAAAAACPFDQLRQTWVADLEARNLDAALALYATDAAFINPDGTHASTPAELRQLYTFIFGAFAATDVKLSSRATGQSGNLAFDSGAYSETVTERGSPPAKGIHHLSGDYLTLYRRSPEGGWLIIQQVWTEAHHITGT